MVTVPVTVRCTRDQGAAGTDTHADGQCLAYTRAERGRSLFMTLLTTETTELTIGELHELAADDFKTLYLEVSRRPGPGAGAYSGVSFLTAGEDASTFETLPEALAFLDALQQHGLPGALREITDSELSDEDVIEAFRFTNGNVPPSQYLEQTGVKEPLNLDITPLVETVEEAPAENTTAEVTADT